MKNNFKKINTIAINDQKRRVEFAKELQGESTLERYMTATKQAEKELEDLRSTREGGEVAEKATRQHLAKHSVIRLSSDRVYTDNVSLISDLLELFDARNKERTLSVDDVQKAMKKAEEAFKNLGHGDSAYKGTTLKVGYSGSFQNAYKWVPMGTFAELEYVGKGRWKVLKVSRLDCRYIEVGLHLPEVIIEREIKKLKQDLISLA